MLGYARLLSLVACFAGAAWLDNTQRRVPNEYWMAWAKPALFLWAMELLIIEADWTIWGTAAAAVALASTALIGRPTLRDVLSGNLVDIMVSAWYVFAGVGIVVGYLQHGSLSSPTAVLLGDATKEAALWWSTLSVLAMVWIFEMMWRFRLLHGGADAKAMMLVAILIPSWATFRPIFGQETWDSALIHMPPALSLLIWGALAFLLIPLYLLALNLSRGNLSGFADLKLAWHSTKMPISQVQGAHVWLLDEVIERADGSIGVKTRGRAPKKTPSDADLAAQIAGLQEIGVETVWVTHKWPLLTILFPAILPLMLWGDPFSMMLMPLLP